jgi:hypothetical protein
MCFKRRDTPFYNIAIWGYTSPALAQQSLRLPQAGYLMFLDFAVPNPITQISTNAAYLSLLQSFALMLAYAYLFHIFLIR